MKKLYLLSTLSLIALVFSGCSKDVLKPYDDRIEGYWTLTDVDRIGFGSIPLDFTEGYFYFDPSGRFEYTDRSGNLYEGSWDIRKEWIRGSCYLDDYGNSICDDRYVKNLRIDATDYNTRDTKSEFFDEMQFTSTNRFKAYIYAGSRTYIFRFKRD
jgi:hypothetical protein